MSSMRKDEILLSLLTHLGPMTSTELWECLWGLHSPIQDREHSKRVLGIYPDTLDYSISRLKREGRITKIGVKKTNAHIWGAVQ